MSDDAAEALMQEIQDFGRLPKEIKGKDLGRIAERNLAKSLLSGARLSGARLSGTRPSGARLSGARLSGAAIRILCVAIYLFKPVPACGSISFVGLFECSRCFSA